MTQHDLVERLRLIARPGVGDVSAGEYKRACSEAADALEQTNTPPQSDLQRKLDMAVEAMTPSGDTKAAYMGEFSFTIQQAQEDEFGEPIEVAHKVYVPWTTIKEIMAAIRARSTLLAIKDTPTNG